MTRIWSVSRERPLCHCPFPYVSFLATVRDKIFCSVSLWSSLKWPLHYYLTTKMLTDCGGLFLLLVLLNSWTLIEQLRFCLHIQQDTAKEAICPQINYFVLHCFCGAKWMRCPLPPTSLLKPSSYCVRLVTAVSLNCRLLGNFSATTFSQGEPLVSTQMKTHALTSWSFNFSLDCL